MSKKRKKKRVVIGTSIVFALMLILIVYLWWSPGGVLTRMVERWLQAELGPNVEFSLGKAKIQLISNNVTLENISFYQTDDQAQPEPWLIQSIAIKEVSLWKFLRTRELEIDKIIIKDPTFKVIWKSSDQRTVKKIPKSLGNLFKSGRINYVEVQNIDFSMFGENDKGYFLQNSVMDLKLWQLELQLSEAGEVNVSLNDFALVITDYELLLPDNLHLLKASKAEINTLFGEITANDVSLVAIDSIMREDRLLFDFHFPEIRLRSDIMANFEQKDLRIDTLIVTKPSLRLISASSSSLIDTNIENANPYDLINGLFSSLEIGWLQIVDGDLKIGSNWDERDGRIEASSVHIELNDFLIDSISYLDPLRIALAKSIEGSMEGLSLDLNDSIHVLTSSELIVSSRDNIFRGTNIEIKPNDISDAQLMQQGSPFFKIYVPELDLSGARLDEMYHGKFFESRKLLINKPRIFLNFAQTNKNDEQVSQDIDLYSLVSEFFQFVKIEELNINEGRLVVTNQKEVGRDTLSIGNIAFNLYGFEIDSATSQRTMDKLFYARHLSMEIEDYQLKLADGIHQLRATGLSLNTMDSTIAIQNLRLSPISRTRSANRNTITYFDLSIPKLDLEGASIKDAFYKENISIRLVEATNPIFNTETISRGKGKDAAKDQNRISSLEGLEDIIGQYINRLIIGEVAIAEGQWNSSLTQARQLNWEVNTKLDAAIFNLSFAPKDTPQAEFDASNTTFQLRNFDLKLPDNLHTVKAQLIDFDWLTGKLKMSDLHIDPSGGVQDKTTLKVFADSLILYNYSPSKETLFISATGPLSLYNPNVEIGLAEKDTVDSKIESVANVLGPIIQVNGGLVQNGQFYLYQQSGDKALPLLKTKFEWVGDTVNILGEEKDYTLKVIQNTLFTQLRDLTFFGNDSSNHHLTLELLNYRNTGNRLEARNLRYTPQDSLSSPDLRLFLEGLILGDFDPVLLYTQKEMRAGLVELYKPEAWIIPNPSNQDIEFSMPAGLNAIDLQTINLAEGKLHSISKANNEWDTLTISGLQGRTSGFLIDNQHTNTLYGQELRLSLSGISIDLPDSLHRVITGPISFDTEDNSMTVDSFSFTPVMDREAYLQKIGYSTDYLNIKTGKINFEGIDVKSFLNKKDLIADKVHVHDMMIDDYRDRNVKEREGFQPLMPMGALMNLENTIIINELQLHNGSISYSELAKEGVVPGVLRFENVNANIYNITNQLGASGDTLLTELKATADLMGAGKMEILFSTNIADTVYHQFRLSGTVYSMPLGAFNDILKPVTFVEVRSGNLRQMDFYFDANKELSNGKIRLDYRKLKVAIYNAETQDMDQERVFMSFMANTFVIKSRSSRRLGRAKEQDIQFERILDKSIFNYWWKSILSGIKPSLGLKNKE